jgi:integrase
MKAGPHAPASSAARTGDVRAAIAAHNKQVGEQEPKQQELAVEASAYSFRHAHISELLQVHGVDPCTVAAQTGTSLAMIEKAYLRFIPSAMREKLAHIKDSSIPVSQKRA